MRKLLLLAGLLISGLAVAADRDAVDEAVAETLFNLDIENASYRVRNDGHVDILFGPSLSSDRYAEALTALKGHPQIPSVLAGRGNTDYCPLP